MGNSQTKQFMTVEELLGENLGINSLPQIEYGESRDCVGKPIKIKKIPMVDLRVALTGDEPVIFSLIISKLHTLEKNIDLVINHINNE
jgi:hypothetical protein